MICWLKKIHKKIFKNSLVSNNRGSVLSVSLIVITILTFTVSTVTASNVNLAGSTTQQMKEVGDESYAKAVIGQAISEFRFFISEGGSYFDYNNVEIPKALAKYGVVVFDATLTTDGYGTYDGLESRIYKFSYTMYDGDILTKSVSAANGGQVALDFRSYDFALATNGNLVMNSGFYDDVDIYGEEIWSSGFAPYVFTSLIWSMTEFEDLDGYNDVEDFEDMFADFETFFEDFLDEFDHLDDEDSYEDLEDDFEDIVDDVEDLMEDYYDGVRVNRIRRYLRWIRWDLEDLFDDIADFVDEFPETSDFLEKTEDLSTPANSNPEYPDLNTSDLYVGYSYEYCVSGCFNTDVDPVMINENTAYNPVSGGNLTDTGDIQSDDISDFFTDFDFDAYVLEVQNSGDATYINSDAYINNTNWYPQTLNGIWIVNGDLDIYGNDVKIQGTIIVLGQVTITFNKGEGFKDGNQNKGFAIVAKDNIIVNSHFESTQSSNNTNTFTAFFYTEESFYIDAVVSRFHLKGSIFARALGNTSNPISLQDESNSPVSGIIINSYQGYIKEDGTAVAGSNSTKNGFIIERLAYENYVGTDTRTFEHIPDFEEIIISGDQISYYESVWTIE